MICPRCKENVIGGNTICPKCGYNFSMNGNQDNIVNNNLNNMTDNNQTMNNTGGMFVNNSVPNNVVNNSSNCSGNFNNNLNSNISKVKKKNNKVIIAIIILIILGVFVFFGYKFFTGKNNDLETNEDGKIGFDAKTSFIQNSDFMYALFDYNGNQITDFIYKYAGILEFTLYGTAIVRNDDGYFLIDQNGNELTKRGEYSDFELNGILFDASYESDDNGKEIFPCEYTTVEVKSAFGAKIVSLMKYGSPKIFVAYDLNNNKEIFNGPGTVEFSDTFYSIYDEEKNAEYYYSYSTGKMFFTRNF